MEREVTLLEMLEAREKRVRQQDVLRERYSAPVVSFTLNIAGPVKDSPLIRRAFQWGQEQLEAGLTAAKLPVLERTERLASTGCEALYMVDGTARAIKAACVSIEDGSPLGRLFDMDVLTPDGRKLEREEVGGGPRNCIVCGATGKGCASRRVHSVEELQGATHRILEEHFAAALAPYWGECFQIGQETAELSPEGTFDALKLAGQGAERTMFAATGGVNTHKGAIFSLGLICGAVGRLWRAEAPCRDPEAILAECARMVSAAVEKAFAALSPDSARTAGERAYLEEGLIGIRGEAAKGFPGVLYTALPVLERALKSGRSKNDAGAIALLHLITRGTDTNMVSRGGPELAKKAAEDCARLVERSPLPEMEEIARLDQKFIQENLSPGGCADLLVRHFSYNIIKIFKKCLSLKS